MALLLVDAVAALRLDLIGRYLRPHRRTVLLGAIALVIVNLLGVTIPMEVQKAVDELQGGFAYRSVLTQAAWIALLASVMGVVRLISRQLVFGVGRQVEVELRQRLFDHMLKQEPAWVQTTGSGEVIARATSDVENIRRLLGFSILSLTNTVLVYSVTLPAMLAIDPGLTAAAVGLYPVMLGCVRLFGGRMMHQQRRQQENLATLSELIQEDLSGMARSRSTARKHPNWRHSASEITTIETARFASHERAAPCFLCWRGFPPFHCCCCCPLAAGSLSPARSAQEVWLP